MAVTPNKYIASALRDLQALKHVQVTPPSPPLAKSDESRKTISVQLPPHLLRPEHEGQELFNLTIALPPQMPAVDAVIREFITGFTYLDPTYGDVYTRLRLALINNIKELFADAAFTRILENEAQFLSKKLETASPTKTKWQRPLNSSRRYDEVVARLHATPSSTRPVIDEELSKCTFKPELAPGSRRILEKRKTSEQTQQTQPVSHTSSSAALPNQTPPQAKKQAMFKPQLTEATLHTLKEMQYHTSIDELAQAKPRVDRQREEDTTGCTFKPEISVASKNLIETTIRNPFKRLYRFAEERQRKMELRRKAEEDRAADELEELQRTRARLGYVPTVAREHAEALSNRLYASGMHTMAQRREYEANPVPHLNRLISPDGKGPYTFTPVVRAYKFVQDGSLTARHQRRRSFGTAILESLDLTTRDHSDLLAADLDTRNSHSAGRARRWGLWGTFADESLYDDKANARQRSIQRSEQDIQTAFDRVYQRGIARSINRERICDDAEASICVLANSIVSSPQSHHLASSRRRRILRTFYRGLITMFSKKDQSDRGTEPKDDAAPVSAAGLKASSEADVLTFSNIDMLHVDPQLADLILIIRNTFPGGSVDEDTFVRDMYHVFDENSYLWLLIE